MPLAARHFFMTELKRPSGTLLELLKEKPKRGRPPRAVSRQTVYVALSKAQKQTMVDLAKRLPGKLRRADLPDLAITALSARLESLRLAMADREVEIPEGITDMESLYLLWDVVLPIANAEERWTSLRVSPQQAIEFGRVQGVLKAAYSASRSQVFALALGLLQQFMEGYSSPVEPPSLSEFRKEIRRNYL